VRMAPVVLTVFTVTTAFVVPPVKVTVLLAA
jgi:hypothetical protein